MKELDTVTIVLLLVGSALVFGAVKNKNPLSIIKGMVTGIKDPIGNASDLVVTKQDPASSGGTSGSQPYGDQLPQGSDNPLAPAV